MRKRVPAAVLAVLLAWSMAAPALAAEESGTEYVSLDTFWNWAAENTGGLLSAIISYGTESVCTVNEDGRHRASSYNYVKKGLSLSEGIVDRPYYRCVCDACGQEFTAYETDVKQSYDTSVADLPATGYNSDGSLLWSPKHKEFYAGYAYSSLSTIYFKYWGCSHYELPVSSGRNNYSAFDSAVTSADCNTYSLSAHIKSGTSGFSIDRIYYAFEDVRPINGFYSLMPTVGVEGYYTTASETVPFSKSFTSGNSVYYDALTQVSLNIFSTDVNVTSAIAFYVQGFAPVYKVVPYDPGFGETNPVYNITTRPTSITGGNYGIIGDNGQITTVTNNNQIVNETNNTYYNPATGETSTITDWSYDYSDRSYNLTLEGGDTSTVTYGDQNITITETTINESGDTIINNYTIYYIIEGSGSGTGPATHTHDWRETSVTDATCIQPGRRVYTCDVCGDTKSETISALGHNWLVLRTVNTEYDEDGALVMEGYVLYQCDRCQEQYKTTSTSSRPPPGGGTTSGSGDVLDELPNFVDMLLEMLQQLPRLFSGFVAFLNAMFAYIPEEIIFMLTFGVAAVVLIGIIKAVRG